jgi:hypothetical protein
MEEMASRRKWTLRIAACLTVLAEPAVTFAQSCAMCYTSASAANDAGTAALRHGIVVLMLPPLLIFIGICIAAFRRNHIN